MDIVKVKAEDLKKMVAKRLTGAGMGAADAGVVADVLVFAELRGVASHGVVRVEHYCNRIKAGGINLRPDLKVEFVKPAIGRLDAKGGMGHVAAVHAMNEALRVAKDQGMAMIGVLNSSHAGALAYYAQMALDRKMASLICIDTDRLVVPFGGRFSFLGSNPLAFGFPGRREDILIDMATSEIPWGKIINHRLQNKPLPPGLTQDAEGNPTTDAAKAVSLTPFGGPKGYSINVMVEALTGLLVGGVFGPHLSKMYEGLDKHRNLSNFFLVIDPTVFYGGDGYLDVAQRMIDEIHSQPALDPAGQVKIPGDIERAAMAKNSVEGIPIPKGIHDFLAG